MQAFGGPVHVFCGDKEDGTSFLLPVEDMERVRQLLAGVNGSRNGSLRIYRPQPTAAFSPRDTTLPSYTNSAEAMRALGFTPVERRAGGQLAAYDRSTLVIDLVAYHPDPRPGVIARFQLLAEAIAGVLRSFSIDARVGAVPGEYCPGSYSVNAGGRVKLAGLAQRIGRHGFHLGAVIAVEESGAVRNAIAEAYRILGFSFDPDSFGAIGSKAAGTDFSSLRHALLTAIAPLASAKEQGGV